MKWPYAGQELERWDIISRWWVLLRHAWDKRCFRSQRAEYFEYLYAVLAGVEFRRTLSDVFWADQQRYQAKHWRGRLAAVWWQTYQQSGGDLYAVWQEYLSNDELVLLRSAQQAGMLEQGLQLLADYLLGMKQHQGLLLSIVWPALVGVWVPVGVLIAVPLYTVPALQDIFQDLPTEFYGHYTQQLFAFAAFLQSYGFGLGIGLIVLLLLLYQALHTQAHVARRFLDRWSIFQLMSQVAALRLLSLLAVLLRPASAKQLSLRTALELMQQGAGPWMRWHLRQILARINEGHIGAHSFNSGLLNPDTYWFFSDMAQAQALDQAARRTAQRLSHQLSWQGQRLATRWRWLILGACAMLTLLMGLWHYVVMDELRQSLSLFYAGM